MVGAGEEEEGGWVWLDQTHLKAYLSFVLELLGVGDLLAS